MINTGPADDTPPYLHPFFCGRTLSAYVAITASNLFNLFIPVQFCRLSKSWVFSSQRAILSAPLFSFLFRIHPSESLGLLSPVASAAVLVESVPSKGVATELAFFPHTIFSSGSHSPLPFFSPPVRTPPEMTVANFYFGADHPWSHYVPTSPDTRPKCNARETSLYLVVYVSAPLSPAAFSSISD